MAVKKTNAKASATKATKAKGTTKRGSTGESTPEPKKKRGRPQKQFDKRMFESMCEMHCTQIEIAHIFDCDTDTINAWCNREYGCNFSEIYNKKVSNGNMSLRRIQFRMAESGSERMAIWLGKQWLGQTDKQEIDMSADISAESRREIEDFLNDNGTNTDS